MRYQTSLFRSQVSVIMVISESVSYIPSARLSIFGPSDLALAFKTTNYNSFKIFVVSIYSIICIIWQKWALDLVRSIFVVNSLIVPYRFQNLLKLGFHHLNSAKGFSRH